MARPEEIEIRFPVITISFVSVPLIAYAWPHLSDLMVYDRQAILAGEFWRLFTAPFVHFSLSHISWDLLTYGAAGWTIETAGYRRYWLVCGAAALIPGPVFLLALPELSHYGGLSGLATGAVAYLCLCEMRGTGNIKILWLAILALISIKTIVETVIGVPIFVSADNMPFRVLPAAHALGFVSALAAFIWTWPRELHSNAVLPNR